MTPEQLAERILQASGSSLRYYKPAMRTRIVNEADYIIQELTAKKEKGA